VRWPGVIEPGRIINDICSLQDFFPTFAAASGEPGLVEKVQEGEVWHEPLVTLRIPRISDLRSDPFERGEERSKYNDWFVEHVPMQCLAQAVVHEWLESFKEFPLRQKSASFSFDKIVATLMSRT